jgi:hypothetical protein
LPGVEDAGEGGEGGVGDGDGDGCLCHGLFSQDGQVERGEQAGFEVRGQGEQEVAGVGDLIQDGIGDYRSLTAWLRKDDGSDGLARRFRVSRGDGCYFSASVNRCHAAAGMLSVVPSRSVVSLTATLPSRMAVSTQLPPLPSE